MKVMPVDYNATTPSGALRLSFPDSRRALDDLGAKPGDWAWLGDGEVVLGARLADEAGFGIVGVPDWGSIIHLDDDNLEDVLQSWTGRPLDENRKGA